MNPQKVALLKKMLKGLMPKKNFDADYAGNSYPHCVIGEKSKNNGKFLMYELFTDKEHAICAGGSSHGLTHAKALAMIRRAIKRWSR